MGSSTRNTYKRTSKIIQSGITDGIVGKTGKGIGELLSEMIYPSKGVSKVRSELQNKLYSQKLSQCIQKLNRVSKAYHSNSLSSIGLGGISSFSIIEQKEILCDYLDIDDDELLKTSFKESIDEESVFDANGNILKFISLFIKNIVENIYKKYTFEDCINELPEFSAEDYKTDLDSYMNLKVYPIIINDIEKMEINDENNFDKKVQNTMTSIMNKLRRVGA